MHGRVSVCDYGDSGNAGGGWWGEGVCNSDPFTWLIKHS